MRILAGLIGVILIAACSPAVDPAPRPSAAEASGAEKGPVAGGWRGETYRGVEVSVPDAWGWGNGSQRLNQWCVDRGGERSPIVGRPGPTTLAGCAAKAAAGSPETMIANTGVVVAFEDIGADDDPTRVPRGGDRLVRDVGSVRVIIQAPKNVRDRIADSVRAVDIDANGCPTDDPIAHGNSVRPVPAVDLREVEEVSAAVACRYALDATTTQTLLSSRALTPSETGDVLEGIKAAAVGGGPDDPHSCAVDAAYGDEAIVLRIRAASGDVLVHVRFSGCDHHGFDDGVTLRRITRTPMQPLIADANGLFSCDGVMAGVLEPNP